MSFGSLGRPVSLNRPSSPAQWTEIWLDKLERSFAKENMSPEIINRCQASVRQLFLTNACHPCSIPPENIRAFLQTAAEELRDLGPIIQTLTLLYRDLARPGTPQALERLELVTNFTAAVKKTTAKKTKTEAKKTKEKKK